MSKLTLIPILGMLLLVAAACAGANASPSPDNADEDALHHFIERLFSDPRRGAAELSLGELPPDFPVSLPDTATVVGSIVHDNGSAQAVVDMPTDTRNALQVLEEEFAEQGWTPPASRTGQADAFVPGQAGYAIFCDEQDRYISVMAHEPEGGGVDVRIHTGGPDLSSPCHLTIEHPSGFRPVEMFPALHPPDGVVQRGGSGGGGSDNRRMFTRLQGDVSAAELEGHYRQQLEDAGWTLIGQGEAEDSAWSMWRFTATDGDEWAASLFTVAVEHSQENLAATISATLVSAE